MHNAVLSSAVVSSVCAFNTANTHYLDSDMDGLGISTRGHKRLLKVAGTLTDLKPSVTNTRRHLAKAISLRQRNPRR
ncbi:MAG: hypothetical protein CMP98_02395 [Gammaproteobacteria bacterium]|nr:hypothetical protein [Gammaproteobacteria bacterium]OUU11375.1 MAG: hypothetical protein CBB94_02500 [Gammaproteobacteria bacterium TMED34]